MTNAQSSPVHNVISFRRSDGDYHVPGPPFIPLDMQDDRARNYLNRLSVVIVRYLEMQNRPQGYCTSY
jgi:hypothetical protein